MAEAYATLANHGQRHTYTMISKDHQGRHRPGQAARAEDHPRGEPRVRRHHRPTSWRASSTMAPRTAAQGADRPAAGKTGTAEKDTAAWFCGLHPRPRHRRLRHGPEPDHRRPRTALRRDGPPPRQRRRGARRDLGPVHQVRPQGHPGERLRPPAPGRRRDGRTPEHPALPSRPPRTARTTAARPPPAARATRARPRAAPPPEEPPTAAPPEARPPPTAAPRRPAARREPPRTAVRPPPAAPTGTTTDGTTTTGGTTGTTTDGTTDGTTTGGTTAGPQSTARKKE
ncbi:hypothetical protein ACRAWF_44650 [Streptomyces sp. L7]